MQRIARLQMRHYLVDVPAAIDNLPRGAVFAAKGGHPNLQDAFGALREE